jgi:hypothetical protein
VMLPHNLHETYASFPPSPRPACSTSAPLVISRLSHSRQPPVQLKRF